MPATAVSTSSPRWSAISTTPSRCCDRMLRGRRADSGATTSSVRAPTTTWSPRNCRRHRLRASSQRVRHLLVTNDFPPKVGGIQSYLWELWRRLPPEDVAVLTTPYAGSAEFDADATF